MLIVLGPVLVDKQSKSPVVVVEILRATQLCLRLIATNLASCGRGRAIRTDPNHGGGASSSDAATPRGGGRAHLRSCREKFGASEEFHDKLPWVGMEPILHSRK